MTRSLADTIRAANAALMVEGKLEQIEEYFTPDYRAHLTGQDMKGGHGAICRVLEMYRRAFPELSVDVKVLVEAGDRVAWQRTLRGEHRGAFQGFPASGRELVWRDMLVSRFEEGRIAEEWLLTDLAEQLLRARKG